MATISDAVNHTVLEFVHALAKNKRIDKVFIYGSYAAGNAGRWSDIDIAVVSPDFSDDLFEERVKLMQLAVSIDDRMEPYPFRTKDFNEDQPLVKEILEKGVEVVW